jgi:chitosanase
MLTDLQKLTIQAIVNVFETGSPAGDYSRITLLPGDPGHLTYGRSQTTLASGSLARLVSDYCAAAQNPAGAALRVYLPRLESCDLTLDTDAPLHVLLRDAASDDAMRRAQDALFDRAYWEPAFRATQALGIQTALGAAVVYDSFIHGAWIRLRNATTAKVGAPSGVPPAASSAGRQWIASYIAIRHNWLATHANPVLRNTVYRMETFAQLLAAANWDLHLPLLAHGVTIDHAHLTTCETAPINA